MGRWKEGQSGERGGERERNTWKMSVGDKAGRERGRGGKRERERMRGEAVVIFSPRAVCGCKAQTKKCQ